MVLAVGAVGFGAWGGIMWFYSSRPRLFVRHCVPRDAWREADTRQILRGRGFKTAMRVMAALGFAACAAFAAGSVFARG
jgi:hypothetical protein